MDNTESKDLKTPDEKCMEAIEKKCIEVIEKMKEAAKEAEEVIKDSSKEE